MSLAPVGYIDLPMHARDGGFDHAAVHRASGRLFVAHTANDAVDIVDIRGNRYLKSVPGLRGVAGVLVSDERNLVFTSNRGEDVVGIFPQGREEELVKVSVGVRPNGLAFEPASGVLLAANVGDPARPESHTITIVDTTRKAAVASARVPGRTRWALFDASTDRFYVNIRDPALVVAIEAKDPTRIAASFPIPAAGPHGLALDPLRRRLYCGCDDGTLVVLGLPDGAPQTMRRLSGPPDVVLFDPSCDCLYVAVGDPGVIDVFDAADFERLESYPTEKGAHTIAFDPETGRIFAFLPATHRAAAFVDEG